MVSWGGKSKLEVQTVQRQRTQSIWGPVSRSVALGCGVKQGGASPFFLSPRTSLQRSARLGQGLSPSRLGLGLLSKELFLPRRVLIADTPLWEYS